MRKLYYLSFFVALCCLLFTSCENELLEGEFASNNTTTIEDCGDASMILQENALALQNATDEDYELVCTNYRIALEGLLESCEDDLDEDTITIIMQLIEQVGDCTVNANLCADAQSVSTAAATAYANESDDDDLCTAYVAALEDEISACGDTDGSIQQTLNTLPCTACGEATLNAEEAQIAFNETEPSDEEEYEALCGLYSQALQAQIAACGDPDGSLMNIVLDLGDCTPPEDDGPVRLLLAGAMKNFNTASVTINGSTLSVVATDIDTGDTFTFDVVLFQTGSNVAQDIELTVDGILHTPFMSGDTPFTSNITENTGTTIVGTFTGTVMNPDGEFVSTANGIIDIEY